MKSVRILAVHGVGYHPPGGSWEAEWKQAIASSWRGASPDVPIEVDFVYLDDIFEDYSIGFFDVLQAVGKLTASAVLSPFRSRSASRGVSSSLRWTAGMVVQWVENSRLRRRTRSRLKEAIEEFDPHVVCAHSLGSLVAYDTFTHPATASAGQGRTFISFGSQIGNAFVSGNFLAGRILPLEQARHWYHLYNSEDAVFAAPIRIHADNFTQVETYFDLPGMADHAAPSYLSHEAVAEQVWVGMLAEARKMPVVRPPRTKKRSTTFGTPPPKRALLVGVNRYQQPGMDLEGCVNDVYLMSQVLHELGFEAEELRVVLDERATADGIRSRLEWLLGEVPDESVRVFYFSGHGAQLDGYNADEVVDRRDECLVPHDFDWSHARAIQDDWFHGLYSQLPYGTNFFSIFDCCHSGGLTRQSGSRVRGISPPDDIRFRALSWDGAAWSSRTHQTRINDATFLRKVDAAEGEGTPSRIGHASALRKLRRRGFNSRRKSLGHEGPYMPLLMFACQESELAFEYKDGQTTYGAFTYSLVAQMRAARRARRNLTFEKLMSRAAEQVAWLGYDQTPKLEGPRVWREETIPMQLK